MYLIWAVRSTIEAWFRGTVASLEIGNGIKKQILDSTGGWGLLFNHITY